MPEQGFILTPSYRVVDGRPVVHTHVVLEDGTPALISDDRSRPYFFVRATDAGAVGDLTVRPTALRTFAGEPVVRVEATLPRDVPPLRERLSAQGTPTFESDVRFAYRYLIDRGIRGAFEITGAASARPDGLRVYHNPELRPATWAPTLRVLSLDIETSPDAASIYSIAVAGAGGEHVFLVASRPVSGATTVPDERTLLAAFVQHVRESGADVLTGWNVCDFDLAVLLRVAHRRGIRLALGRDDDEPDIRRDPGFTRESRVQLAGRVVLDGLALLRSAFYRLDDYTLETAAQTLLGRGKRFAGPHRHTQIEAAFRDDPAELAAYNLEDARLVLDILAKTGLVELTVRRSLTTGMPLDRVSAQIAAIDSLYLGALRRRGRVAPSVAADARAEGIAGGLVLDAVPGLYRNIAVFDFKSLYPSLIRTFNIDPLTHLADPLGREDVVHTPGGAAFRADEEGILPALVARLARERAAARATGDGVGAQALKILMNSMFGVLGSPASRLFSPAVANAITRAGQHVIGRAVRAVEGEGHRVIYGDTDSLFIDLAEADARRAVAAAELLRARVERRVAEELEGEFGCTSHLELEYEKLYERFFLPASKKRYAGLSAGTLEVVGLEAARRDWTPVARRFQRELLARVFRDEPVTDFIRAFVASLREGAFDAELVYRKALRKPLEAYTRTTPPHVKAARRQAGGPGRLVHYLVTRNGPEPSDAPTAPVDREHYVVHQLRPIAEAILRFVGGPGFDRVAGLDRQLELF